MIEFILDSPVVAAAVGAVVLLLLVVYMIVQRFNVAGPNEAFILTGRRGTTDDADAGQKVVVGAGVFVWPLVQRLHVLDLSSRRINVRISGAVSHNGIKLDLDGVAVVKVAGDEDGIRAAAQRFLNQQGEIDVFTTEVLAGALRAIVGRMTVDQIIRDRAAFASAVAEEAETSLTNQGLVLDTFQIQDVKTEGSYLDDLGRPEAARARRDASIAEARANQESERERLAAEEQILAAQRDFELRQAEILAQTEAAKAQAEAAGPLAKAAKDQEVLEAQEKVAVRNAALKDRQLDTEVRKPADAERYRIEQAAEAERTSQVLSADAARQARIAEAEAAAREAELLGEAEKAQRSALAEAEAIEGAKQGEAEKARRLAVAEAVRAEGEAEAAAIHAKGQAEADAMEAKATAFDKYGEAAILQLVVDKLPDLVAGAAAPIGNIDQLTVISADGSSAVPRQVASNVAQGLQMLSDVTGVDLKGLLAAIAAGRAAPATPAGDAPPVDTTLPTASLEG